MNPRGLPVYVVRVVAPDPPQLRVISIYFHAGKFRHAKRGLVHLVYPLHGEWAPVATRFWGEIFYGANPLRSRIISWRSPMEPSLISNPRHRQVPDGSLLLIS